MPPGPAYNRLCVAHSVCDILSHAAQIRAAQLARTARVVDGVDGLSRKRKRHESYPGTHTKLDSVETAVAQTAQSRQEPLPRTGTSALPPTSSAVTGDPSTSQYRTAELPSAQVQHGRLKVSLHPDFVSNELKSGGTELTEDLGGGSRSLYKSPASPELSYREL